MAGQTDILVNTGATEDLSTLVAMLLDRQRSQSIRIMSGASEITHLPTEVIQLSST